MTREDAISIMNVIVHMLEEKYDTDRVEDAVDMAIKALKQEPCEDAISFPKGTLKKRGKGYVVYNPEWLKENWRTELKVMGIECEDAISRQAVLDGLANIAKAKARSDAQKSLMGRVIFFTKQLPSVTPKQKMGRWKVASDGYGDNAYICECSECKDTVWVYKDADRKWNYCPNCGAKMSEIPTGSNCTACILDGTDACSRGAGRAVDGRVCEDFVGESED